MRDLVIMPAMAQRRESLNMGEFAEEAIIVEEVAAPKRVNHFIEANTQEVTLQHLQQDCIIPSFASMEETISHQSFIGAVVDAAGKSSVSCPLKPSDSAPLKHSTMPP